MVGVSEKDINADVGEERSGGVRAGAGQAIFLVKSYDSCEP